MYIYIYTHTHTHIHTHTHTMGGGRVRERERGTEIYYEEVAHARMKAEKSHDLPSASGRPKKASGVIQSKSKGLRTRGADDVNPSLRAGEDEMFQFSQ